MGGVVPRLFSDFWAWRRLKSIRILEIMDATVRDTCFDPMNDANDRLITGRAEPYLLRRYVDYREAVRVTASIV